MGILQANMDKSRRRLSEVGESKVGSGNSRCKAVERFPLHVPLDSHFQIREFTPTSESLINPTGVDAVRQIIMLVKENDLLR